MQPMIGLPSGLERVRWNEIRHFAAAFDHAENLCAARLGMLEEAPAAIAHASHNKRGGKIVFQL